MANSDAISLSGRRRASDILAFQEARAGRHIPLMAPPRSASWANNCRADFANRDSRCPISQINGHFHGQPGRQGQGQGGNDRIARVGHVEDLPAGRGHVQGRNTRSEERHAVGTRVISTAPSSNSANRVPALARPLSSSIWQPAACSASPRFGLTTVAPR